MSPVTLLAILQDVEHWEVLSIVPSHWWEQDDTKPHDQSHLETHTHTRMYAIFFLKELRSFVTINLI